MSDYDRTKFKREAGHGVSSGITTQQSVTDSFQGYVDVRSGGAGINLKGMKHDDGKEPLSLLSRVWLLCVASVMGFGARKYAAHNWRNGLERSRLISAAIRHIIAYNEGEDQDPETGLSHLDHASCCLMFARELHETRPDLDDRYKGIQK